MWGMSDEGINDDCWGFVLSVRVGGGRFLRRKVDERFFGFC